PIGTAVGPPIESPQIVARDVLAIFGEFDARAAVRAGVPPRNVSLHRPPGEQRQSRQTRQHLRVEKAAGLTVGEHVVSACCQDTSPKRKRGKSPPPQNPRLRFGLVCLSLLQRLANQASDDLLGV